MQWLVRFFDNLDDLFGILEAAPSRVFLLIVLLSILLMLAATAAMGLRGFAFGVSIGFAAIALATGGWRRKA